MKYPLIQSRIWMFISFTMLFACTSQQLSQSLGGILTTDSSPTSQEVASGLKEALINGIRKGSNQASKVDGYFKHPRIKIPFPPDIQKVETKLRQVGLGRQVDKFVLSINRGAEKAAVEAKPIFISAIKSMTIQDAWGILKGEKNAATQYLQRTTTSQLTTKFRPVIKKSLDQVNATKYYGDVVGSYNKIPFVTKVDSDLAGYTTQKAIDGLFFLIAKEEANIRANPVARTTELLKKVFGFEG